MNKIFFTIDNCKNEEDRLKRVDEYVSSLALELNCEILNYLDVGVSFFINDYWNIEDYPDDNFDKAMKVDVLLHIEEELKYKITENDKKDLPFPKIKYIHTLEKIKGITKTFKRTEEINNLATKRTFQYIVKGIKEHKYDI